MRYRPDIDGLRGLAVVAAVIFHASPGLLTGGYVGVDMFFVISGFLITGILMSDMATGRFSLITFYERRCRRILPALTVICGLVTIAAWFCLFPYDFKNFGRSVAAAFTFWANFFFWNQSGYFDTAALSKPLLHTWSLSLEEQYYIFFPLILLFLFKKTKGRPRLGLMAIAAVSMVAAIWQVKTFPSTAFYLLHTRAWELLLGAVMVLTPWCLNLNLGRKGMIFWSMAGLLSIIMPMWFYTPQTSFPGLAALPICLGTAILIAIHCQGPERSLIGRFLSSRVMVGLGKISYSLYLWHWPLLVLPAYVKGTPLSPCETVAAVASALILSILTWYLVEQPVRKKKIFISRNAVFAASLISLVIMAGVGRLIKSADGVPERLPERARLYAASAEDSYQSPPAQPFYKTVVNGVEYEIKAWKVRPESDVPPSFAVWGDSHARMWRPAVETMAAEYNLNGLVIDPSNCWPLLDSGGTEPKLGWNCNDFDLAVVEMLKENHVQHLFLAIRYILMIEGTITHDKGAGGPANQLATPALDGMRSDIQKRLEKTVEHLNAEGLEVWIMENAPDFSSNMVNTLTRAAMRGESAESQGYEISVYEKRQHRALEIVKSVLGEKVHFLPITPFACPSGWCAPGDDRGSFYTDDNHFTNFGAMHFKEALRPMFKFMAGLGHSQALNEDDFRVEPSQITSIQNN